MTPMEKFLEHINNTTIHHAIGGYDQLDLRYVKNDDLTTRRSEYTLKSELANYISAASHQFITDAERDRWNNINTSIQVTLLKSSWKNKRCTIQHQSIKKDALIILSLPIGSSNSVRNMIGEANIVCIKQDDGAIELEATNVPDFDVYIILTISTLRLIADNVSSISPSP